VSNQTKQQNDHASPELNPGDEAAPGTAGTGEDTCRVCNGAGKVGGRDCPNCGGTGKVVQGVGGAWRRGPAPRTAKA